MPSLTPTYQVISFPSGMNRGKAAAHVGISPGYFDKMVKEGLLPPPRILGSKNMWIRQELDDALFALDTPQTEGGPTSCDAAFGM
jgi:predicted DNA-binding transcriptional regulator AlpA